MNKPTDDTNAQNSGTYELRMRLALGAVQGELTIKSDAIGVARLIRAAVGRIVEPVAATRGVSSNFVLFDRHGTTDPPAEPDDNPTSFPETQEDVAANLSADFWENAQAYETAYEGAKPSIYHDTKGHLTVGVGLNLDRSDADDLLRQVGADPAAIRAGTATLSDDQMKQLFHLVFTPVVVAALNNVPNFVDLEPARQFVIVDMMFNMGVTNVLTSFPKFLANVKNGDFSAASFEILHDSKGGPSKFLLDTHQRRAGTDAAMMASGKFQPIQEDALGKAPTAGGNGQPSRPPLGGDMKGAAANRPEPSNTPSTTPSGPQNTPAPQPNSPTPEHDPGSPGVSTSPGVLGGNPGGTPVAGNEGGSGGGEGGGEGGDARTSRRARTHAR